MAEVHEVPALARPTQMLVRAGVFDSHKEAEKQLRLGNVYIEIKAEEYWSVYWVRVEDPNTLLLIAKDTRVKYIDGAGKEHYHYLRPYKGTDTRG